MPTYPNSVRYRQNPSGIPRNVIYERGLFAPLFPQFTIADTYTSYPIAHSAFLSYRRVYGATGQGREACWGTSREVYPTSITNDGGFSGGGTRVRASTVTGTVYYRIPIGGGTGSGRPLTIPKRVRLFVSLHYEGHTWHDAVPNQSLVTTFPNAGGLFTHTYTDWSGSPSFSRATRTNAWLTAFHAVRDRLAAERPDIACQVIVSSLPPTEFLPDGYMGMTDRVGGLGMFFFPDLSAPHGHSGKHFLSYALPGFGGPEETFAPANTISVNLQRAWNQGGEYPVNGRIYGDALDIFAIAELGNGRHPYVNAAVPLPYIGTQAALDAIEFAGGAPFQSLSVETIDVRFELPAGASTQFAQTDSSTLEELAVAMAAKLYRRYQMGFLYDTAPPLAEEAVSSDQNTLITTDFTDAAWHYVYTWRQTTANVDGLSRPVIFSFYRYPLILGPPATHFFDAIVLQPCVNVHDDVKSNFRGFITSMVARNRAELGQRVDTYGMSFVGDMPYTAIDVDRIVSMIDAHFPVTTVV